MSLRKRPNLSGDCYISIDTDGECHNEYYINMGLHNLSIKKMQAIEKYKNINFYLSVCGENQMSDIIKEHHILLIQAQEISYSVHLEAATLTLGRSNLNSIIINDDYVSRIHALLIRCPVPDSSYYTYEIIDGSLSGCPSSNGIYINGQSCTRKTLQHGDMIKLSDFTEIAYFKVHMSFEEVHEYLLINAHETSTPIFPGNSLETFIPDEAALEILASIQDISGPITHLR